MAHLCRARCGIFFQLVFLLQTRLIVNPCNVDMTKTFSRRGLFSISLKHARHI
jgi:hypothetical protein